MNVLGKLKSKKPKTEENGNQSQMPQIIQTQIKALESKQQKPNQLFSVAKQNSPSKQSKQDEASKRLRPFKATKPVVETEFIINTNVLSKQKQKQWKEQKEQYQDSMRSFPSGNSMSSSFGKVFQTKKESKKPGVLFNGISNTRGSSNLIEPSERNVNDDDSVTNEDDFGFDFDFLLSQRQKKEIKKSLQLSRGKAENVKVIEQELKEQHEQVLSFAIKKWSLFSDVYVFDGELESLKRRYIEIEGEKGKVKVYERIKAKISCGKEIIMSPQTIGRIFISGVIFLSENEAMILSQHLVKTIERSKRRGKNA